MQLRYTIEKKSAELVQSLTIGNQRERNAGRACASSPTDLTRVLRTKIAKAEADLGPETLTLADLKRILRAFVAELEFTAQLG